MYFFLKSTIRTDINNISKIISTSKCARSVVISNVERTFLLLFWLFVCECLSVCLESFIFVSAISLGMKKVYMFTCVFQPKIDQVDTVFFKSKCVCLPRTCPPFLALVRGLPKEETDMMTHYWSWTQIMDGCTPFDSADSSSSWFENWIVWKHSMGFFFFF